MANYFNNIALLFLISSLWTNCAIIPLYKNFASISHLASFLRRFSSALFQIHFWKSTLFLQWEILAKEGEKTVYYHATLWSQSNNFVYIGSTLPAALLFWQIIGIIDCNWHPFHWDTATSVRSVEYIVISHSCFISWFVQHSHGFTSFAH